MSDTDRSVDRLWLWFAIVSVATLVVLAISPVKDYFREYRRYQNRYRAALLKSASTMREVRSAREQTVGIRQIWIPQFDNRVDRCTTCHLGVDEPAMTEAPAPFRTHPRTPHTPDDLQRFGCVACHQGQGRATSLAEAHGDVPDWDEPLLPVRYTEATCGRCHAGDTVPEASQLSAGRQLMTRVGCSGCHKLGGSNDVPRVGPDLNGLRQKTNPAWRRAWLKSPRSLRPKTWMPDFHLGDEEIDDLVQFLWVQAPTEGQKLDSDGELPAGDGTRGRILFSRSRCISCHTVEGKGNGSAPELSGIGSMVTRRWLVAFLGDPQGFQPETRMPRYDFSLQDRLDLADYMLDEFTDSSAPAPTAALRPDQQVVQAGEQVWKKYGCAGCHRIAGRDDAVPTGPDLTGIGEKPAKQLDFGKRQDLPHRLPDWLAAKVRDPRSFREGLHMPEFGFDDQQVVELVTALLSLPRKPVPESYRVPAPSPHYVPPGRFGDMVSRYRCMSCHQIQGTGGDISTAPLTAEGSKVRRDWLKSYILHPFTLRPVLTDRMIPLQMSPDEADFLTGFIENVYLDNRIPDDIFPAGPSAEQIDRGRMLYYQRYGCQACHMIAGKGGYYGPLLDGVGQRLKSGWVYWWLKGPQRWRPDVREPDYGLSDEDARDLAAFVVSIPAAKNAQDAGQ